MFVRMLIRAAAPRRGRAASALLAVIVAASAATAMLNLFVDVQTKLHSEFRKYGANIVVVGKDGQALAADDLAKIKPLMSGHGLAVPFAYVVARTSDRQSVVVSGTDLEQVRRLDSWWSVTAWPSGPLQALVGTRAAPVVSTSGAPFDLSFQGRNIHLVTAGTLRTGAAEDSRVYLSLNDFENWTAVPPSTVEIAANGSADELNATIDRLRQALPDAEVRPVRQVMEGEARVLGKTRETLLASTILIVLTAALCLLSTLIGWVFDRRRDFAIMKALGASERLIGSFFAAEAATLGVVGAALGFVIGVGIAAWIGRANFHATIGPRFNILPVILLGGMSLALLSAALPMLLLRRVQPAPLLRGE